MRAGHKDSAFPSIHLHLRARQLLPTTSRSWQLRPTEIMDLYVAQLPGLSVATHLARERAKADEDMPDNKSWRLGHSKQPKKPPRVSTPQKMVIVQIFERFERSPSSAQLATTTSRQQTADTCGRYISHACHRRYI